MQRMMHTGADTMTSLHHLIELPRDWARQETHALTAPVGRRSSGAFGHADEAGQPVLGGFHAGAKPAFVRHLLAPSHSTEPPQQRRIEP